MLREILLSFGSLICDILSTAILIQILLLWILGPNNKGSNFLETITFPVMNIAKKITPKMGMLDFSPVIAMISLEIIKSVWIMLISQI